MHRHIPALRLTGAAVFASSMVALLGATPSTPTPSPMVSAPGTPVASQAPTEQVLVPRGTIVVVKTTHGLNSYGEESGTKVVYEVVQDVVIDGHVVAQAGDVAEGVVQDSQSGRNDFFTYKAANLRLSVDSVFNFCGDTLRTDFVRSEFRQRQGFMGSHKDVEVIKGQMYQVPTERPQKVCATKTTEAPLPIPTGALEGDKN